jgi:hypothetical protein
MSEIPEMNRVLAVKAKYEQELLRKKNVVGLGVGFRQRDGIFTDELVLTVMVRQKQPFSALRARDRVPTELEGVPIDVQEVGTLRAF